MRAIAQNPAALLRSYGQPATDTSSELSDTAIVIIWGLAGLSVSALCHVSEIYDQMGDLLAFLG